MLRKLRAFTEFDDIEVWELLRISAWRKADEHTTLMRERDADQRFGIVLEGEVEISVDGRRVARYGPGEFFGELAWLDSLDHRHLTTVVTVVATTYLEINPSALALASDEVRELFRTLLSTVVARRLGAAARELAKHGEAAVRGDFTATGGLDLQLVDD
jgi:non-specific serine/threonine protein kinase